MDAVRPSEPVMALRLHLPHRTAPPAHGPPAHGPPSRGRRRPPEERHLGARVFAVQRTGAVLMALFLLVFGLLGLARGQEFLSTEGTSVLGMSSNGLLSTISVVVAIVLLVAAARSPRTASTVMVVLGILFLISALANLAVLETDLNLLAFEFSNVVFSVAVGVLLLVLGAYGRFTGHLPPDSPYAHPVPADDYADDLPRTPREFAAERAMRQAEVAAAQHTATPEQYQRVQAMRRVHSREDRRRVWMSFDGT